MGKALQVPPPHVKLMWACKELDDSGKDSRRYIPQAWTRQNGPTALHLRQWVATACNIDEDDVRAEGHEGQMVDDDFTDWASLLDDDLCGGLVVTAFRYVDATCDDVSLAVGKEVRLGASKVSTPILREGHVASSFHGGA